MGQRHNAHADKQCQVFQGDLVETKSKTYTGVNSSSDARARQEILEAPRDGQVGQYDTTD